jgi:(R,R)-butanediol dehydrogenase/meso-butanediol dehydrogenase/diacetyl reductase
LLVRTEFSGVSIGTEQSIFSGKRTHNGTFPFVGGYMLSGTVERVGENVEKFNAGDRVVCPGARLSGKINSIWGTHSQFVTTNQNVVIPVPDNVKMEEAAMFVLPSVGLNAFKMVEINNNDAVIVQGQGLIGQFYAQFCKDAGAEVLTIEPNETRAELSKAYVTDFVFSPGDFKISEWVDKMVANGKRIIVTEATGNKNLIANALKYIRPNSTFVFLGWYPDLIELDYNAFHANQVKALFPMGTGDAGTLQEVIDSLVSNRLKVEKNITDMLNFSEACNGYARIVNRDDSIMGMVFDWRNS